MFLAERMIPTFVVLPGGVFVCMKRIRVRYSTLSKDLFVPLL